jgi:hypothetical protein
VAIDFLLRLVVIEKKNAARYLREQQERSESEPQQQPPDAQEGNAQQTGDSSDASTGDEAGGAQNDERSEGRPLQSQPTERSSLVRYRPTSDNTSPNRSDRPKPILSAIAQMIHDPQIVVCFALIVVAGFVTGNGSDDWTGPLTCLDICELIDERFKGGLVEGCMTLRLRQLYGLDPQGAGLVFFGMVCLAPLLVSVFI